MEMQIGRATVENSMELHQQIKNQTALWSSSHTSGIYPKISETLILKNIYTFLLIAA